jgi:hypothetical protein
MPEVSDDKFFALMLSSCVAVEARGKLRYFRI